MFCRTWPLTSQAKPARRGHMAGLPTVTVAAWGLRVLLSGTPPLPSPLPRGRAMTLEQAIEYALRVGEGDAVVTHSPHLEK